MKPTPAITKRPDGRYDVKIRNVVNALTPSELHALWIAAGDAFLPGCDRCAAFAETVPGESCAGCQREWIWEALKAEVAE